MAAKKETVAAAPVVSDKKKALETAMQQRDHVHRDPLYPVCDPVSGGNGAGEEV